MRAVIVGKTKASGARHARRGGARQTSTENVGNMLVVVVLVFIHEKNFQQIMRLDFFICTSIGTHLSGNTFRKSADFDTSSLALGS